MEVAGNNREEPQSIASSSAGLLGSQPAEGDQETVFPWSLAEEVFDKLKARDASVIRYCDLATDKSWWGSTLRYLDEYIEFRAGSKSPLSFVRGLLSYAGIRWGERFPRLNKRAVSRAGSAPPPTVILQHDADLLPDKTCEMMQREALRGLLSSNYVFVEHATETDYHLDIDSLQAYERNGFEIGYHQNAFERSNYELEEAYILVNKDVAWLKQFFDIRSFVPHGGEPSGDGRNNEHLPRRHALKDLLWAYNGKCILKDYTWSDGGIKKRAPSDPRVFVDNLVPGTRAMMLMHPQYYGTKLRDDWKSLPIAEESWWRNLWGL